MLLPPGVEVHSYEPTVRDILTLHQADVFIYVGGESDTWLEKVLSSIDTSQMRIIRLVDCVDLLDEHGFDERGAVATDVSSSTSAFNVSGSDNSPGSRGGVDLEFDEHVWTTPSNAKRIVEVLTHVFMQLDPSHASAYLGNAKAYCAKLDALDARFRHIVASAQRTTLVFGDRFPFRYLAEEYGLTCYAAFSGCSSATDINARTISFLINTVRSEAIPVVFYVGLTSHRIADAICEETGAMILPLHACHTVSKEDFEAGVNYLDLMERNALNLERALL